MPCLILKKTSRRTQAVDVSEGIFCAARCCVIFYLQSMKVYLHSPTGMVSRTFYVQHSVTKNILYSSIIEMQIMQSSYCVCVVFSSHSFWTSSSLDVPAGVTQEEGHTGFLTHLLSAVRALIFLARRIQPFLSLVDREVEFCVLKEVPTIALPRGDTKMVFWLVNVHIFLYTRAQIDAPARLEAHYARNKPMDASGSFLCLPSVSCSCNINNQLLYTVLTVGSRY